MQTKYETLPIAKGENAKLSDKEIELEASLIENMSDEVKPEKYRDEDQPSS